MHASFLASTLASIRTLAASLALCGLCALGACSQPAQPWHLTDVSGHLPDLDFSLIDDGGASVTGHSFAGRTTLVYFGHTHCPDVCPETMARLMQVLQRVGPDADKTRIVFISVDSARDTPALLRAYVRAFDNRHAVGLTGSDRAIETVAQCYRVAYQMDKRDPDGAYEVTHSSAVYIFDRDGHARLLTTDHDSVDAIRRSETRDRRKGFMMLGTLLYWLDPWEPSPTVVIAMLTAAVLFARGARHARVSTSQRIAFWFGLDALYVALHTRLDYFFEHEFFMHRLQHLVLHHPRAVLHRAVVSGRGVARGRSVFVAPALAAAGYADASGARPLRRGVQSGGGGAAVRRPDLLADPLQGDARLPALSRDELEHGDRRPAVLVAWWLVLNPRPAPPARLAPGRRTAIPPQIILGAYIFFTPHELYPIYSICGPRVHLDHADARSADRRPAAVDSRLDDERHRHVDRAAPLAAAVGAIAAALRAMRARAPRPAAHVAVMT